MFIEFLLALYLGPALAPEGGSRAAAISTPQPDHHLAGAAPLNRRRLRAVPVLLMGT